MPPRSLPRWPVLFVVAGLLVSALGVGGPAVRAASLVDPPARQVENPPTDAAATDAAATDAAATDASTPGVAPEDPRARAAHYQQVREELFAIVEQQDPRAALARMRALMKDDPVLLRSCHPFMHQIGRRSYTRYGSFAEAATYRDDICNSGYLHGVIEAYFLAVPDPLNAMKTVCDGYEPNKYHSWQCYHGVGHGLMFFKKNDLPTVLALCAAYDSPFARGTCANGAYMENFNTDGQMHPSRYVSPNDPFFPCDLEGLGYQSDCYLYVPTYYLALHEREYEGALKLCTTAPGHMRAVCTEGVGSQAIKENLDDPLLVERLCDAGETWQHRPCISGMIGLFANHHGALEPVEQLCDTLRADNKAICESSVRSRRGFF